MIGSIEPEAFEELINSIKRSGKELTSRELVDFAKYLRRQSVRESEIESAVKTGLKVDPGERIKILGGDFRELFTEEMVEDASVDMILTDPPYSAESLDLWKDLTQFAARVLKPGRVLVTYSGTYHLDRVIDCLRQDLHYVWTCAMINASPPDTIFPRNIMSCWKPVLLFSKGDYSPLEKKEWFRDRIDGDGRVKSHHAWEQGVGEAKHIIAALTHEGNLPGSLLRGPEL